MAAGSPWALSAAPHVAVIGGGIVGCSIAYHLAKSGARVTLIEQHALATGASHGTFAWINATWAKQPRHYHQFSQAGVKAWRRLEHELTIPVKWGGSLEWFASATRQQQLLSDIKEQIAWGEPARMVAKERLEQLEPNVDFSGTSDAAFSPNDGAVNPVLASHDHGPGSCRVGCCHQGTMPRRVSHRAPQRTGHASIPARVCSP